MRDLVVFVIFDKVTGQYSMPMLQVNKEMAIRHFNKLTQNPANLSETTDYQLFLSGTYNQETGLVTSLDRPEFVMNAKKIVGEADNE